MLSQWLVPELDKILHQDGAPVHFWTPVREWLNKIFATWIGCGGPLIWPPRSPDLTTCDNWLWSYLKENLSIIQMDSVELKRERDIPYLQNAHSRYAQAGKQTDIAAHSTVRGKWLCIYWNVRRLTMAMTDPGKLFFAYFQPLILGGEGFD